MFHRGGGIFNRGKNIFHRVVQSVGEYLEAFSTVEEKLLPGYGGTSFLKVASKLYSRVGLFFFIPSAEIPGCQALTFLGLLWYSCKIEHAA